MDQRRAARNALSDIDLAAERARPKPPTREELLEAELNTLKSRLAALEDRTPKR